MLSVTARDSYRLTSIFMVFIILGIQWGFYRPYLSEFPDFIDTTPVIHIHGALMMGWMMLLVFQPMLIFMKKVKWHRMLGKVSWVLGPLIIISMFQVGKESYWRGLDFIPLSEGSFTVADNLTFMVLDIRGFLFFAIFWALGMAYRKNSSTHMRYMIATGILAIGPGVGRGLANTLGVPFQAAITITDVLDLLIVGVLLGYDLMKNKNPRPYLLVFVLLLMGSILWQINYSSAWQSFAQVYAELFY